MYIKMVKIWNRVLLVGTEDENPLNLVNSWIREWYERWVKDNILGIVVSYAVITVLGKREK